MNFNLVSDEDNGFRYNAYFGEQIVIPADSKAYLNFATLYRKNGVILEGDNTITLVVDHADIVPTDVVDDLGGAPVPNSISIQKTVPAGRYKVPAFQAKIREIIQEICRQDSGGGAGPPPITSGRLFNYYSYDPQAPYSNSEVMLNLSLKDDLVVVDMTLDTTNEHRASFQNNVFSKTGDARPGDYRGSLADNYGMATQRIFFGTEEGVIEDQCGKVAFVVDANEEASAYVGLYNTNYPSLATPLGQGATAGNSDPRALTVKWEDQDEFDASLPVATPGAFVQGALAFNPNVFRGGTPPSASQYYEGFKISIVDPTGTGATTAIAYPRLDESAILPGTTGIMNFVYSGGAGAKVTGLGAGATVKLGQFNTSGSGSGFSIECTADGAGEIGSVELLAGKIVAPGVQYDILDSVNLTDLVGPGTGTLAITIQMIARAGPCNGIFQPPENTEFVSSFDKNGSARTMGAGFKENMAVQITQESTVDTGLPVTNDPAQLGGSPIAECNAIPCTFVGVEISGTTDTATPYLNNINIYHAINGTGEFIGNTPGQTQNIAINEMELVTSVPKPPAEAELHMAIKTYADYRNDFERNVIYYKVGYYRGGNNDDFVPIYDSRDNDLYFSESFYKDLVVADTNSMNCQNFAGVYLGVGSRGTQVREIQILPYDMLTNTESNGALRPSIAQEARFEISGELAQVLGFTSGAILPSSNFTDLITQRITDLSVHWSNSSYYVVIEELPLTNYKNKRDQNATATGKIKKGMVKNILANIPVPFEALTSSLVTPNDEVLLGGLYDPHKKVIVNLRNNQISTNQLSVRLFKMETDLPAKEILQSVINFTIMPPGDIRED